MNADGYFGYDGLDRLTSHTSSTGALGYAYDLTGNRTQVTYGGSVYASTTFATSNRLASVTGPSPAKTNIFDAAGNLTSDGTVMYTYSDRGRLQRVVTESLATNYLYNGRGERVAKSGASVATGVNYYAYDADGRLVGEYLAGGALIQETAYLQGIPAIVLKSDATTQYYVYADHIETPRVITRSTDNGMVWRWDHADPFGVQQPIESPIGLPAFSYNMRFPGQLFDKESNNHYNYFRDYDPQSGRYVQSDPIGLYGGINTYVYVEGDPVSNSDPEGLISGGRRSGGSGIQPKDFGKNKPMDPMPDAEGMKREAARKQEHGQNLADWAKCHFGIKNCEAEEEIAKTRICIVADCETTCPVRTFKVNYGTGSSMAFDAANTTCKCVVWGWNPGYRGSALPGLGAPGR